MGILQMVNETMLLYRIVVVSRTGSCNFLRNFKTKGFFNIQSKIQMPKHEPNFILYLKKKTL